jgi:hypothetical protein
VLADHDTEENEQALFRNRNNKIECHVESIDSHLLRFRHERTQTPPLCFGITFWTSGQRCSSISALFGRHPTPTQLFETRTLDHEPPTAKEARGSGKANYHFCPGQHTMEIDATPFELVPSFTGGKFSATISLWIRSVMRRHCCNCLLSCFGI